MIERRPRCIWHDVFDINHTTSRCRLVSKPQVYMSAVRLDCRRGRNQCLRQYAGEVMKDMSVAAPHTAEA